jgi:hypothetical protein
MKRWKYTPVDRVLGISLYMTKVELAERDGVQHYVVRDDGENDPHYRRSWVAKADTPELALAKSLGMSVEELTGAIERWKSPEEANKEAKKAEKEIALLGRVRRVLSAFNHWE